MNRLPTDAELDTSERAQEKAVDGMEKIVLNVGEFASLYEVGEPLPPVMPTHGDAGRLYLHVYYARVRAGALRRAADELEQLIPVVAEIPLNAQLRAVA